MDSSSLSNKATQEEAHHFFDQLQPVRIDEITGRWKGREWKTGHPMDGLLEHANWYGKTFSVNGEAHPLIFQKKNGELFKLNPDWLPAGFPIEKIPKRLIHPILTLFHPLLSTNKTKARLRKVELRGKVSTAMIYDRVAIIDHLRKIDNRTLLGLMEYKGQPENIHYFFILEKENE